LKTKVGLFLTANEKKINMSGGSYDYIGFRIRDLRDQIRSQDKDPRRASFAKLMSLVGDAMHDIEWVDSGDCGEGDEHKSIDKVFHFLGTDPEIIKKAHAYDSLTERLKEFFK
jgi:hypothetical protein